MLGIEHGHHHHRTVALALADQTLVGALDAIAEAQLQLLDSEQSALRDDLAGEYGGFLTHVDNSWRSRRVIIPRLFRLSLSEIDGKRQISRIDRDEPRQEPPCPPCPGPPSTPCCSTLDGTLLDLHFDNHFWLEHLPQRYAERNGLSRTEADAVLEPLFREHAGQLNWYCLDFWSRELDLSIRELKHEVAHLISLRPHADTFLAALRRAGKRVALITNAHRDSLSLKLERIELAPYFDRLISSHDYGYPKEDARFWSALQADFGFDPQRSLFIDDSLPILRSARAYGVAHLLAVRHPDSRGQVRDTEEVRRPGGLPAAARRTAVAAETKTPPRGRGWRNAGITRECAGPGRGRSCPDG